MRTSWKVTGLLLAFLVTGWGSILHAQKKPVPAKAPVKVAPQPPQKTEVGKEEQELSAPTPTAVKLPKRHYENEDISKNETRGTFTLAVSAGLYNFTNKTENPATNTSRSYTLPFDYTTMLGLELAFRLGKDKEKDHDTQKGFHYYRSNRGIFTDFELGLKTQRTSDKPSRFNYSETSPSGTTEVPVDLGYDYTSTALAANVTAAQNLNRAGISPQLKQAAGATATDVTMVYANTYYHFTPLNFIMNWGSGFRWFDASLGPSIRIWYYKDYSDPVRTTTRNDDWTYSTFMLVYRQYIQFHPTVRLRTHFYFPALTYFTELAKSPRFNEMEYILNTALEFYAIRAGSVGLIVSAGYEGHWWFANPYSTDRLVRTGFTGDSGSTDATYAGFEHKTRTSWEAFATVAVELHFGGDAPSKEISVDTAPATLQSVNPNTTDQSAIKTPTPARPR